MLSAGINQTVYVNSEKTNHLPRGSRFMAGQKPHPFNFDNLSLNAELQSEGQNMCTVEICLLQNPIGLEM